MHFRIMTGFVRLFDSFREDPDAPAGGNGEGTIVRKKTVKSIEESCFRHDRNRQATATA
jgi:hypothetical protein